MFTLKTTGELRRSHPLPSWLDDAALMLVHEDDLTLEGDLPLDDEAGWRDGSILPLLAERTGIAAPPRPAHALHGLIVVGDLRLSGALVNAEGDFGPTLLVTGSLHARQASCGGAYIHVVGDMVLAECAYAHYNHGQLVIEGTLTALALVNNDHGIDIRGKMPRGKPPCIDIGDPAAAIPPALKKLLKGSLLSLGMVLDGLRRGQPLESLKTPQTMDEWRDVVWRDFTRIGRIPKELHGEALYLMLLAPACPLPKGEVYHVVQMIPAAHLTPAVRMAAFLLAPRSLVQLPARFDLQREYETCFLALDDPRPFVGEIPEQYLSPAMRERLAAMA